MNPINVGLVGAGTVGGGVIKLLHERMEFIRGNLGVPLRIKRIADKNTERFAQVPVGDAIVSAEASDILNDKEIQVVVELVGGTGFARQLIGDALRQRKHVVTANKALIAEYGYELFELAETQGVSVNFEAAVGGGMPVIKTIREALISNRIVSVKTIINGTCNYILSQMSDKGLLFDTALKKAQKSGFAEADPTLDIGGGDSGHKVAIMASLIHGGYVPYNKMFIEGITGISKEDIDYARDLGYSIKLLGIIRRNDSESAIDVRVHPVMLHHRHILASVSENFNAVLLQGHAVGPILIYGQGAGEMPTASAVVSDLIDVGRNILGRDEKRIPMGYYRLDNELAIKPVEEIESRYYLCFWVQDRPKVLASIASLLGEHAISIASVLQREGVQEHGVPVIFLTHKARESNVRTALAEIEKLPIIRKKTHLIRIAGHDY